MKALTLWQPWASLMAIGDKTIETRGPWALRLRSLIGSDVAIHAAARRPTDAERQVGDWTVAWHPDLGEFFLDHDRVERIEECPLGAVVAVVTVTDVVPMVDGREPTRDHGATRYVAVSPNVLALGTYHPEHRSGDLLNIERERPYGHYEPGRVAIVTTNRRSLNDEPVPCGGHQQVWNLPLEVEAQVLAQLGESSGRLL